MINTNYNNTYINKNNIAKKDQVSFGKIFAIKYKIDGKYVKLNDPNNMSNFLKDKQRLLEELKPQNNLFFKEDLSPRKTLSDVADDYIPNEKYIFKSEIILNDLGCTDTFLLDDEIRNKVNEKLNYKEYSSDVGTLCFDISNNKWLLMTGRENFILQAIFNVRKNINALWAEKIGENNYILNVDTCEKVLKETGIALRKILMDENSWVKGKEVVVIEAERDKVHTNVVRLKNISFDTNSNIREELDI